MALFSGPLTAAPPVSPDTYKPLKSSLGDLYKGTRGPRARLLIRLLATLEIVWGGLRTKAAGLKAPLPQFAFLSQQLR